MGRKSKLEYLLKIIGRYRRSGRKGKTSILGEFCAVCGYHRKHAIRLLSARNKGRVRKPGRPSRYGELEVKVLETIWLASERPCAKRLKVNLAMWVPWYEVEYGRLTQSVRDNLLQVSPRTLDRLMKPVRRQHGIRGKCGTRPGTLLRHQIPIKTEHSDVTKPGVMEADTVAHCWDSLAGNFMWSLTLTDIYSGWTENRAVWNKGYDGVRKAIENIEETLPFGITGFHSDNGGEFLNHHLVRFLQDRNLPVAMTRGRPYHKDDTAHVEQKNYTHVRALLGYQRIEDPKLLEPINELYRLWSLFNNLSLSNLKLTEKVKTGSRYTRRHGDIRSPYQRLMDSPDVTEPIKTHLTEKVANINPFTISASIQRKRAQILAMLR